MEKPTITFADFDKLDLRVGTVLEVREVSGSEKLDELVVDLGKIGQRTLLSGIRKYFKPEGLVGLQVLVIVNLEPKKMMGLESQGMILMADPSRLGSPSGEATGRSEADVLEESTPVLMVPQFKAPNGSRVI